MISSDCGTSPPKLSMFALISSILGLELGTEVASSTQLFDAAVENLSKSVEERLRLLAEGLRFEDLEQLLAPSRGMAFGVDSSLDEGAGAGRLDRRGGPLRQ